MARLYSDLAHLWPLLSPPEQYVPEAEVLRNLMKEELGEPSPRWRLLELGVGGGHTLSHLVDQVEATGVDRSPEMLANCRKLVPEARLLNGDLRDLRLGETFDAVLLHDAVDYLTTEEELAQAAATVAAHVRSGGIAIVAPTYVEETFEPHSYNDDQHQSEDGQLTVTFLSYVYDPNPADTHFEMLLTYLINRSGEVEVVEDRHRCGLFPRATWERILRAAGLEVELFEDDYWSLFLCRKP